MASGLRGQITGKQDVSNRIHRSKIVYTSLKGLSEQEILCSKCSTGKRANNEI